MFHGRTRLRPSHKNAVHEMLKTVDRLVSVGSVDGICTTAAVLRNARCECGIDFCQAFTVDRIDPELWPASRRVLFIGVPANSRKLSLTADFLRRVTTAGHKIIGVLDEHRADEWVVAFSGAGLRASRLLVKPVTGLNQHVRSAGKLLLRLLGDAADEHTRELCLAGNAADRMNFETHFGGIVNSAVKPRLDDDSRREYLARHLATNRDPDATIQGWMAEYEEIQRNHERIIAERRDLGDGIVRVAAYGLAIDMTALVAALYALGYRVSIVDGESFHPQSGQMLRQLSFGCARGVRLDLVSAMKATGLSVNGYRRKATVALADELRAVEVVRELLFERTQR